MVPAKANSPDAQKAARAFLFPKPSFTVGLEPEVAGVSPMYAEIYGQVQEAESQGLNFLVGMGYRKALEFLIKDYLTKKHPGRREKIQELPLGKCIKNEVSDPKIQSCAERAVWLGNDETHYLREWTDKDIDDLKVLLKLTRHWIAAEILTEEYAQSMTKKK
jgi:hypothetical protein